jgi:hypothetical protein
MSGWKFGQGGFMAEKPVERLVSGRDVSGERVDRKLDAPVRRAEKSEREPGSEAKKILDSFGKPKRQRVEKFPSGGKRIDGPSR